MKKIMLIIGLLSFFSVGVSFANHSNNHTAPQQKENLKRLKRLEKKLEKLSYRVTDLEDNSRSSQNPKAILYCVCTFEKVIRASGLTVFYADGSSSVVALGVGGNYRSTQEDCEGRLRASIPACSLKK